MLSFAHKMGAGICLSMLLGGCSYPGSVEPFDESRVVLMQLTDMQQGESVGIVSTSEGEFTVRFFPSEAPQAVETFISIARNGGYDGQVISSAPQGEGSYFIAEMSAKEKKRVDPFQAEISYNLCSFPGAVSMEMDKRGKSNGRFQVAPTNVVSDKVLSNLEREGFPKVVAEAFREKGGYPEYWLKEPIFAQVIEGQEVVDKISENILESNGKEIVIEKVSIERYSG